MAKLKLENIYTSERPAMARDEIARMNKDELLSGIIKLVVRTIIIAGLILGGIRAYHYFFTIDAQEAADTIIEQLQAGECDAIYNNDTSMRYRDETSLAVWKLTCDRISPVLQGNPEFISKIEPGKLGDVATADVEYEILGVDDYRYFVEVGLVNEEGTWRMLYFNSESK